MSSASQKKRERWFEVLTAILLGVITVTSALTGYQAARWLGVQAENYALATSQQVKATEDAIAAGQLMQYDESTFHEWLNAYNAGDTQLAAFYQKRFRDEFRVASDAWLATDPFNNPNAPAGPSFMPQYKVSLNEQSDQLEARAEQLIQAARVANLKSDDFILNTVILATTLFFSAIILRFLFFKIKVVMLSAAFLIFLFGVYRLITLSLS